MERTCILVLGMHRSGTSSVTRVLNLLGADLPANLLPPNPAENETGFWESADIVAIHDQFLSAIGSSWHDCRPIGEGALESEAGQRCRAALAELIRREFADSRLFVIKDPRMARLAPLWFRLLDDMTIRRVAVIPVRHPLAVADSLARRNGFSRNTSLVLWLRHVLEAEAASRGMPRAVLSYDAMLANPQAALRPLCDQLGCFDTAALDHALPQIHDFLSDRHRHHLYDEEHLLADESVSAWIRHAFAGLRTGGQAVLDGIAGELARSMELFSDLIDPRRDAEFAEALARAEKAQADAEDLGGELASARAAFTDALAQANQRAVRAEQQAQEGQTRIEVLTECLELANQRAVEAERQAQESQARIEVLAERLELANQRAVGAERQVQEGQARIEVLAERLELTQADLKAREHEVERVRRQMAADRQRMDDQIAMLTGLVRQRANAGLSAKVRRVAATACLVPALLRGLLDTEWYGKGSRTAALLHYLVVGRRRGASPHPLMDVDYYLRENPDVAASGDDPVAHYVRFGWREGRKPHPLFDTLFYLNAHGDVREQGCNPLVHYIRHGWRERRNPNAAFDAAAYERTSGCRGNPLVHYLREGRDAGAPL
jgi:hypothetical protein